MGLSRGISREPPTSAYDSYEFRTQVSANRDILAGTRVTRSFTQSWDFGDWVKYKTELLDGMLLVPRMLEFDLWCYQTFAEKRIG